MAQLSATTATASQTRSRAQGERPAAVSRGAMASGGASRSARRHHVLIQWLVRLARLPVVNCRGHYTISKLAAFHAYNRSTSMAGALLGTILVTAPCMVVLIAMELIPLQDPALGWRGNSAALWRTLGTHFFIVASVTTETQELFPAMQMGWRQACIAGLLESVIYVAVVIAVSEASGYYPVPFTHLLGGVCIFAVGAPLAFLHVRHRIATIPNFYQRYKQANDLITLESSPIFIYAIVATVFMQLSATQQLLFSTCLPIVKQLYRYVLWRHSRHVVDIMGSVLYGTGYLFHLLFTATCLQNAKSTSTLVVLTAWNIAQAILYAHETKQDAKLRARLEGLLSKETSLRSRPANDVGKPIDLVADVLELMEQELERDAPSPIVLEYLRLAPYHRYATDKWTAVRRKWTQLADGSIFLGQTQPQTFSLPRRASVAMQQWVQRQQVASGDTGATPSATSRLASLVIGPTPASIHPAPAALPQATAPHGGASPSPTTSAPASSATLRSTVRAQCIVDFAASMHRNELVLHRCFLSLVVPILYGAFACILYSLPNRKYHRFMQDLRSPAELAKVLTFLVSFVAVEIGFLTFHVVMMRRTLGVSALRQIAFVISSQRYLMIPKSIALTLVIFSFPIAHCGNDLTFRFEWLHANATMGTSAGFEGGGPAH